MVFTETIVEDAACLVLSMFGVGYGWLIFVFVAALVIRDVLGAALYNKVKMEIIRQGT
jgi:hypothetical protein